MAPKKELVVAGLLALHAAISLVTFVAIDGRLLTLVVGTNVGVGLTGAVLWAILAFRPGWFHDGAAPAADP